MGVGQHKEQAKEERERDERVAAFVERLGLERDMGLSFTENLRRFFSQNEVEPEVEQMVWKCVGR